MSRADGDPLVLATDGARPRWQWSSSPEVVLR
jgi:hypothetical protein